MTTRTQPVRIYQSSYRTLDGDLHDLISLILEDDTGGLKRPNADAVRQAMIANEAILVRDTFNGRLLAGSILYDRGVLEDGRLLLEFGSVTAHRCPGHDLLPKMSRIFTSRVSILQPDSVVIGVVRFDNEVQNHGSLHQLKKAGYVPIDPATLDAVKRIRKLDPGREVLRFDPEAACVQARLLKAAVDAGLIPNKVPTLPALDPLYSLSPISDGLLDDYIASTCTKPCRLVG